MGQNDNTKQIITAAVEEIKGYVDTRLEQQSEELKGHVYTRLVQQSGELKEYVDNSQRVNFEDLKQYVDSRLDQRLILQTAEIKQDFRQELHQEIRRVEEKIDNMTEHIGQAIDISNEEHQRQLNNHERRILKLERSST